MAGYSVRVYVVQLADAQGNLTGPVVAAKLTYKAAHEIAKEYAPAKVTPMIADKSSVPNNPDFHST
ncbi:hypothetical protein [Nitratireductor sp. OM-1]|uniref:hypothetical protein n=1 Tax=Nitratireductor sp. OM-1 TaxID=1756988 RepID=UPI000DDDAFAA|nr:hypothetical protein [Nitratireductor sp. OM-1]